MNADVNNTNRIRLYGIRKELFDMANSYAGNEHGHIACRLHGISNSVYNIRDIMEVLYPLEATPAESRYGRDVEPEKVKSLAQYLGEYLDYEVDLGNINAGDVVELFAYDSWRELLKQALDAYESTENVKIRIERI